MRKPALISFALLSVCFALAVTVEPRLSTEKSLARHDGAPLEVILGDARRLFAGHFFVKADVYFHSGYYPSIFDQNGQGRDNHIATSTGAVEGNEHAGEGDFLGKPLDFIDRFSRSFYPSTHTHLDAAEAEHCSDPSHHHEHGEHHDDHDDKGEDHGDDHDSTAKTGSGKVREMLPWLKLTAELDPNRIETYTVGAYWLRTRLNKPDQAEAFLRDGLRANPGSYAILFELGRIYSESRNDPDRARHLWEAALTRWEQQEKSKTDPDTFLLLQISWNLSRLEQNSGNIAKAVHYLELAKTASPHPDLIEVQINELKSKL